MIFLEVDFLTCPAEIGDSLDVIFLQLANPVATVKNSKSRYLANLCFMCELSRACLGLINTYLGDCYFASIPHRVRGIPLAATPSASPSLLQPIKAPLTRGRDQGVIVGSGSARGTSTTEPTNILVMNQHPPVFSQLGIYLSL